MATRRWFLKGSLAAGGAALVGCGDPGTALGEAGASDTAAPDAGGLPDVDFPANPCPDPFAGGTLTGLLAWVGEGDRPLETKVGEGWDGRLYTDLSEITEDALLTSVDDFYIRTFAPPGLDALEPWQVRVGGQAWSMDDLAPFVEARGSLVMECSGNGPKSHFGLLSACAWRGVPLAAVLDLPDAARVKVVGYDAHTIPSTHSVPGASWIFTAQQLRQGFLATHMNDEPLTADHGAPIRLMMPNWYGCTCIKWVTHIEEVPDDAPATAHMQEFAKRTHQVGVPTLARDYRPATMDQAALPIRVERWEVDGEAALRVVGILWGGYQVTDALEIRLGANAPWVPVDVCPAQTANQPWTLWSHRWEPDGPGDVLIRLRVADPRVPTQRLDTGYYDRVIRVEPQT